MLQSHQDTKNLVPLCLGGTLLLHPMYKLLRKALFLLPAEMAHYFSMNALKLLCSIPVLNAVTRASFQFRTDNIQPHLFGLRFRNPVGLGAGFDKNARYLRELDVLNFGFVEIGTVTPRPQAGNPKPRLFRLPKDLALINRMGFNNDGVEAVVERLKAWKKERLLPRMLVGGNIGKNKDTANEDAAKDYQICFRALHPYVDFFIVNVSSPNTPGLRALQEKEALRGILTSLQEMNKDFKEPKPILLKIAPDLTQEAIEDVVALALEIRLDGLVCSNTTISREHLITPTEEVEKIGAGGLSGSPLKTRSTEVVKLVHELAQGQIPIIGSGGIFTGQDAKEKLQAGAKLVEVWTGFIYEGPRIVKKICGVLERI